MDVFVEPFVQAALAGGRRRDAGRRGAGAAGAQHGLRRRAGRRCARAARRRARSGRARHPVASLDELAGVARSSRPTAAVVASQGHYDEEALETLLRAGVPYVGPGRLPQAGRDSPAPARRKRRARRRGHAESGRTRPGGAGRAEVALSILAEIVQSPSARATRRPRPPPPCDDAVDRCCGMSVDVASARQTAEITASVYYFCCARAARGSSRRRRHIRRPPMTNAAALHDRFRDAGSSSRGVRDGAPDHARAREAAADRGPAGVGKTESAKVLAEVLGTELIRLQCYEGLDAMSALYEWNYPRQMLHARLERNRRASLEEREARSSASNSCSSGRCSRRSRATDRPCCSSTKSTGQTKRSRRFSSKCSPNGRSRSPSSGHPRPAQAARDPHQQSHARAVRRAAPALPVPLAAVSVARPGDRDPRRAESRAVGAAAPDRAAHAGAARPAAAEGARRGREPRLGDGADEPAPRSPRARTLAQTLGCVLKVHEDHAVCTTTSRARADAGRRPGPLESGGYSLGTDFGFGSVSRRAVDVPFASLPENLVAFGADPAPRHGFRSGLVSSHDAARRPRHRRACRPAVGPPRASRDPERQRCRRTVFDQAFDAFFFPAAAALRLEQMPSSRREPGRTPTAERSRC